MENLASKNKIVAVLNKNLEVGVALNAIAHMSAGLVASANEETRREMSFIDYPDKDNINHKSISALSLIVLRGKSGEIKKAINQAKEAGLHNIDFIETMTGDTYKEQLERTANTPNEEVNYYGMMMFGEKTLIDPITKKLSLWK